jgi:hypothetical protein
MAQGVPIEAICLYPITDYAGWDNGRHCSVGLFGDADSAGERPVHAPLLAEIARQRAIFAEFAGARAAPTAAAASR